MAEFLHEPVPDEVKPGAPVAPVRAVEIVVDGSERKAVGGAVVEATLPPIATAEVSPRAGTEATVTVCENVILPAGGLVEMQYGVAVPLEVVDGEAPGSYEGPVVAEGCTQAFTPRLARDDPVLPVDSQRRRVKQRQATEATVDDYDDNECVAISSRRRVDCTAASTSGDAEWQTCAAGYERRRGSGALVCD